MLGMAKTYLCAKNQKAPLDPKDEVEVTGKIVVITGSNSGIGQATAFEMAKRGAVVVMACRDMVKAAKVVSEIKSKYPQATLDLIHLDLGDLKSVRKCAEEIRGKFSQINILINNAGLLYTDGVIRKTVDEFEVHMGVNHLGPFLFTMLLLDLVKAGAPSRIVFTVSTLHLLAELNLDDLMLEKRGSFGFRHWGPYNNSKLGSMYFALALAKQLVGTGVNTYAICPGYVKTDAFRNESGFGACFSKIGLLFGGLSPEQGCETILYCSLSNKVANDTGKMYHFNHLWEKAMDDLDDEIGKKLWEMSTELVGLNVKEAGAPSVNENNDSIQETSLK